MVDPKATLYVNILQNGTGEGRRVSIAATHFPRKYELDRVQTVQSQPYQKRCNIGIKITLPLFYREARFHRDVAGLLQGARSDAIYVIPISLPPKSQKGPGGRE